MFVLYNPDENENDANDDDDDDDDAIGRSPPKRNEKKMRSAGSICRAPPAADKAESLHSNEERNVYK